MSLRTAIQTARTPSLKNTTFIHSRIVKDQPILDFQKKPEENEGTAFALFYLLFLTSPHSAGGANRDRTGDLLLAKQALSQLSYGPVTPSLLFDSPLTLRSVSGGSGWI